MLKVITIQILSMPIPLQPVSMCCVLEGFRLKGRIFQPLNILHHYYRNNDKLSLYFPYKQMTVNAEDALLLYLIRMMSAGKPNRRVSVTGAVKNILTL